MKNKFDRFINFGSITDKNKRAEIAAFVYEQLQKAQGSSVSLSNSNTDNFATSIETILSNNKTMRELCAKDPHLAEQVTGDVLDFINETKRLIQKTENPLEGEQKYLDNFEQVDKTSFEESWEVTAPFYSEKLRNAGS